MTAQIVSPKELHYLCKLKMILLEFFEFGNTISARGLVLQYVRMFCGAREQQTQPNIIISFEN
jgi:hypothetical protein